MMIPKSFKNIENKKLLLFQSIPKTGGRFIHRTLTDDEVDKIMVRIVSFLSKKFNAKLRA